MSNKSTREERSVIKGCQKRIVRIKTKSDLFEEAFLILKDEEEAPCDCDMVREAERILSESVNGKGRRAFVFGWGEVLFFGAGLLLSLLFWCVLGLFW